MIGKFILLSTLCFAINALEELEEIRVRRSPERKEPWELNPNVERDENGNVRAGAEIQRKGENHDFNAGWSKVVRGPNKAKPTWHAGGTIRWRRSADEDSFDAEEARVKRSPKDKEPWELNPNVDRDENGNVRAGAEIQRKGENHDFNAGWSKVVRGPNKAKPTWHAGGTIRWRRSADEDSFDAEDARVKRSPKDKEPWELNPNVERDENGNVRAGAEIQRKGENHDFNAGWSKVVRGPNKAKPTWHAGGTIRWRRSADEDSFDAEEARVKRSPKDKEPWELNPNVDRDENGNVRAGAEIQRKGENHDFNAGWSKVVRGPNKAKPTWHAGGTIRWRRLADVDSFDAEDAA